VTAGEVLFVVAYVSNFVTVFVTHRFLTWWLTDVCSSSAILLAVHLARTTIKPLQYVSDKYRPTGSDQQEDLATLGSVQLRQTLALWTLASRLPGKRPLLETNGDILWTQQRSSGVCSERRSPVTMQRYKKTVSSVDVSVHNIQAVVLKSHVPFTELQHSAARHGVKFAVPDTCLICFLCCANLLNIQRNYFLFVWLIRLDTDSSLRLYEEMAKEHSDFLPLHVARLHSLDSEEVTVLIKFYIWHHLCK